MKDLTAMVFWYGVAWMVRLIMFFTYNRLMLLMALITLPLLWYDYHEMRTILYVFSGF